jgi:hypothetical protein
LDLEDATSSLEAKTGAAALTSVLQMIHWANKVTPLIEYASAGFIADAMQFAHNEIIVLPARLASSRTSSVPPLWGENSSRRGFDDGLRLELLTKRLGQYYGGVC